MSRHHSTTHIHGVPSVPAKPTGNQSNPQESSEIKQSGGPRVFVAMPFGEKKVKREVYTESDTLSPREKKERTRKEIRVDFNAIWEWLIRPALEQAGCRPYRADDEVSAGDIRTDMFFELVTGEFVLADISTLNANVFYELGIRHGISPNGVLMVDGGWNRRPFDVAPDRTFSYKGSLFEAGANKDDRAWKEELEEEIAKLARRLRAAVASDASTTSSPVYKELSGLKPVDWSEIQNAKARYFGSQLKEWKARVRKAGRQGYVGDILTLSRDAPNRIIEWQLRLDTARALCDLGRYERARELLRAMVTENPTCSETRYALAKTLALLATVTVVKPGSKLKQEYQARAELEIQEALNRGGCDPEAHRLLGGIYKSRWRNRWEDADDENERRRLASQYWETAKKGLSYYQEAQMRDLGCFRAGLNICSLFRLSLYLSINGPSETEAELQDVVGLVKTAAHRTLMIAKRDTSFEKDESDGIWATAVLAEVALLTDKLDEAGKLYQRAVTHPDVSVSQLKSFDDQLEMYEKLGFEKNCVVGVREILNAQLGKQKKPGDVDRSDGGADSSASVFVFKGGSIDDTELDESHLSRLRSILKKKLKKMKIRQGDMVICSGQNGLEIILAEECVRLEANVRLFLPLRRAEFVRQSVREIGPGWDQRFYRLADQDNCEVLEQPIRLGATPEDVDSYDRNNAWCLDVARTELGPDVRPRVIILSIRSDDRAESRNKASSLSHFERCAQDLDLPVERVSLWSAAEDETVLPPYGTVVRVRRPNSKADTFPLIKEIRVGRAEKNDVILNDGTISRYHLKLKLAAGGVLLMNLTQHPNSTLLDGNALDPCSERPITLEQTIELPDGTQITFE